MPSRVHMADLRSFLNELKRRKVVRTAAVYAVVAWMVVEVASVVMPALDLPEWTVTFVVVLALLGFPLVLTLEWVFETTAEGVRRTAGDLPAGEGMAGRTALTGGGLLSRPAGMGAVALVALALGTWHFWPSGAAPEDASDAPLAEASLAVFPFDVRGGADIAYLREGMVDLLSTKLDGTRSLRPLDPRTVLTFITREGMDPTDPDVARDVSRRFGAAHYIQGSVLEFSGRLQVKAALYRIDGDGRAVVEAAVEGGADELFALVDDLAVEILTTGTGGSVSRLTRLAALTTDSLSALKAYLEGESAYRAGQWTESMGGYRKAVDIDSTFALAHYRLASAASWAEQRDVADAALDAAVSHAGRLSPHDRLLVEAQHAYREGRHADAERLYREITRSYPDDVEAWYQLGEVRLHKGLVLGLGGEESRTAFQRAVNFDPELYPALWHLSNHAAVTGRSEDLDSLTATILRLNPDDLAIRTQHAIARGDASELNPLLDAMSRPANRLTAAWMSMMASDRGTAERLLGILTPTDQPPRWRAEAHTLIAGARLAAGRWNDARASLAEARRIDPAYGLELAAYLALVAPPDVAAGDLGPLHADLAAWDGTGSEPPGTRPGFDAPHGGVHGLLRLYLLGLVEARLGRPDDARSRADALAATEAPEGYESWARDLVAVVRAEAARAEGDPTRALALLEGAPLWTVLEVDERLSFLVGHWYPVLLRSELLRESGRHREALRWYGVFPYPGEATGRTALWRTAQLHEALGEPERAAEIYRELRERWGDADETFEPLLATFPQ